MKHSSLAINFRVLLLGLAFLAMGPLPADSTAPALIENHRIELGALATGASRSWTVRSIEIRGRGLFDFELREVPVFAPAAEIVVQDEAGQQAVVRPSTRFLRGNVRGMPGSRVAISVTDDGKIAGLASDGYVTWKIAPRPHDGALEGVMLEEGEDLAPSNFRCGAEDLPDLQILQPEPLAMQQPLPPLALTGDEFFQITVAIETDYEFFQIFGDAQAAATYIGNLFNYINSIYEEETKTRLVVGDVFLWSSSNQPWIENSKTSCRLYEFGRYWRDNRAGVERTVAHFLSGRSLGGGIAWLDTLCFTAQTVSSPTGCASIGNDLVFGGFGLSAGLAGSYQTQAGIAWDAFVVAHEIGHNVGSRHTHCYGGIGGNSSPVDACYNQESGAGCWTGITGLPGVGSLSGGLSGERTGTLMSYCHLLQGGLGNIAATFGHDHPFGAQAHRVPALMASRVAAVAANDPTCIPVISENPSLIVSKVGDGSGVIESSPQGIDCGDLCAATFASGTEVTLSASPESGSVFGGWSGACDGTATCSVSMTQSRNVAAAFHLVPSEPVALFNGQALDGISGSTGSTRNFFIDIPDGTAGLRIQTTGGTGDVDLHVRYGRPPTLDDFDCRPYSEGNEESCSFTSPSAGRYYVMLHGYSAYSGVTLQASYESVSKQVLSVSRNGTGSGTVTSSPAGIDCGVSCSAAFDAGTEVTLAARAVEGSAFEGWTGACTGAGACTVSMTRPRSVSAVFETVTDAVIALSNGERVPGLSGLNDSVSVYFIDVPGGTSKLLVQILGGEGDADLYVRYGNVPTFSEFDCRPFEYGNEESCSFSDPSAGRWYVMLHAYQSYSDLDLWASFTDVTDGYTLSVSRTGTGSGRVTSSPAGIDCGTVCAADFAPSSQVSLTPTPNQGSVFAAWAGACGGDAGCNVDMESAKAVRATFKSSTPDEPPAPARLAIASSYVAFFERAPDFEGLSFWSWVANNSGLQELALMRELAAGFASHPSFTALYGELDDLAFIDAIYLNIGGALPDAQGREYWAAQILGGTLSRTDFVADFVFGLLNISEDVLDQLLSDGVITQLEYAGALLRKQRLTNRAIVGLSFAETLETAANLETGTDPLDPGSLARDPVYQAAQKIVSGVSQLSSTRDAVLGYLGAQPAPTISEINDAAPADLFGR